MTRFQQRALSMMWLIALVFTSSFFCPKEARAASADGFTYTVAAGKATVTGCAGVCPVNLLIPPSLGGYTVVKIADAAFIGRSLSSLTLPNSVTEIGNTAFYSNSLSSLVIPNSVITIGQWAFRENLLSSVAFGTSTETIGDLAFSDNLLTNLSISNSITSIGQNAFDNNLLTSVSIGNSVKVIGAYAFQRNRISSLTLGLAVETIGEGAFYGTEFTQVTTLTVPNSVKTIGGVAFINNKISQLVLGSGVTSIGAAAFAGNELTEVAIPRGVTSIEEMAFGGNVLTSVQIPNSVTAIKYRAFQFNKLKSIVIPSSVRSISPIAFEGNLLESVFFLGDAPIGSPEIFINNPDLTHVTRFDGTAGWDFLFSGTPVVSIPVTYSYTVVGSESSVTGCEAVCPEQLEIPGTLGGYPVTSIGSGAFDNMHVTTVTIPDSVTTIGDRAFEGNAISVLELPASVQSIGVSAFQNNSLSSVSFLGNAPSAGSAVFALNPLLTQVRRPKTATGWTNSWGGIAVEYKDSQVITFGPLSGRTVLAAPAILLASASSGLTVSFASETLETCSVSGTTLSIVDIGTCTVTAAQVGDSAYLAALPVSHSFVITRALLTNKTVRFTGPDGTTPIVGAAVTWSSRDGAYQSTSSATTNASGAIVFNSIPGGAIDFAVSGAVIGDWSGYQEVSGFVGSTATTVRLASNSYSYFTTTLTVQMPDGSPVEGAAVALQRYDVHGSSENRFCRPYQRYEWLLRDCKFQGVTDAFGRVTFRIIPTTLTTDCCGEGVRTWAEVSISDASISYTTEAEVFDNVATAVIEIEQLPVVDMLAVDALVGYAAPRTITAVARDSSGDPIAGQALTLSASVSGASASCSGKKTTATTGSTGIATFKVCPVKTAVWSVDGASIVGSSGVTLTVQLTPTAPRSLTSTGKTKAVALVWTAPASVNIGAVTDYIVQYRLQGSSTWITFRDGTSTARKATVTGLVKGRVYEFRIAAKNKAGTGTWSATVLRAAK